MHLLFLDESGQLAEKKFFALGGIALRDSDWPFLRELWQSTLAEHGWPADREVKWHGIRTGEVPPALADAVVSALARAPVTCYVTLLEIELGLSEAPEFFATRFREDDARLRRFFADLTHDGTPYSKLDRIVEGLFLGPSHYSIGLQSADLVVAITAAAERGGGQARGYLRTLLPRFACHPATGAFEGVGIKRFPEQVRRPRAETRLFEPPSAETPPVAPVLFLPVGL